MYSTTDAIAKSLRLDPIALHKFVDEHWERYGATQNSRGKYEIASVFIGQLVKEFEAHQASLGTKGKGPAAP